MQNIIDSFIWAWDGLSDFFREMFSLGPQGLINLISAFLPLSPFQPYIQQLAGLPYLGYLNWFFPIGDAIVITASWLGAVSLFYTYMGVLRWVKVIGD